MIKITFPSLSWPNDPGEDLSSNKQGFRHGQQGLHLSVVVSGCLYNMYAVSHVYQNPYDGKERQWPFTVG